MTSLDDFLVTKNMTEIKDIPWEPNPPKPNPPKPLVSISTNDYSPVVTTHTGFYWSMAMIPIAITLVIVMAMVYLCKR